MKTRKNQIRKLSSVIGTSGLGLFLITGLTGCTDKCDSDNFKYLTQKEQLECKDKRYNSGYSAGSSSSSHSSGFFAPMIFSSNYGSSKGSSSSSSSSHSSFGG